jgi:nitrite reductase/ring-hydroxylating ferredoxin subunit
MATCEVCGNDYDKAMEITHEGRTATFDSFECAIHALAPECGHCGVKISGHGIEADGRVFCCAHCAEQQGVTGAVDRVS